jgi:hypothetical protein
MSKEASQIIFLGLKPTKALESFVQKQIEKWINREQSLLFLPKESSYEVTLEREIDPPSSDCHLRVQIGNKIWESYDTGKTVEDALLKAIQGLRPPCLEAIPPTVHVHHAENVA